MTTGHSITLRLVLMASAIGGAACAARPAPSVPQMTPEMAILLDEDVVITAEDGSWAFEHGTPFQPPFVHERNWSVDALEEDPDWGLRSFGTLEDSSEPYYMRVSVVKDGYEKPFYGVLVFSTVAETAQAIAKRAWRVTIPDRRLREAENGGLSMVYGTIQARYYRHDGDDWVLRPFRVTHWILWLSDFPL